MEVTQVEPSEADHLAAFPEQNPNLVIETDLDGAVTYLNPVASARFPELWDNGGTHPLLADVTLFVDTFRAEGLEFKSRELVVGDSVFEQKVCYTPRADEAVIRIYVHDITAIRQAERQIAELAKRVVQSQEEERHRVARELHDEAGQALIALKISLQLLAGEADGDLKDSLDDAVQLVEETRERIRRLARGLHPPVLDALGLNRSLAQMCSEAAERTGMTVEYSGTEELGLSEEASVSLYRFVQEALTNVTEHSRATTVDVSLESNEDTMRLSVVDDGMGMDQQALDDPARTGLGLVGMRERLELLSGRLELTSFPGEGTRLTAILPLDGDA